MLYFFRVSVMAIRTQITLEFEFSKIEVLQKALLYTVICNVLINSLAIICVTDGCGWGTKAALASRR